MVEYLIDSVNSWKWVLDNSWLIISGLFALITLAKGGIIVRESHVVLTELFGKQYRILHPGLHILIPYAETPKIVSWTHILEGSGGRRIVRTQNITQVPTNESLYDIAPCDVVLKDNKRAEVNAVFTWVIQNPGQAVYAIQDLPLALEMLVQGKLHSTCSELTFDEISKERHIVQKQVLHKFNGDRQLEAWGVAIKSLELQEIGLARDLREAFEERQRAEMKRAAEYERTQSESERMLQAQEAQAKAAVIKANGEFERIVLKAKSDAQAREVESNARLLVSKAEAEDIEMKLSAGLSAEQYIELARISAQRVASESLLVAGTGVGSRMVVVPYDSSALFASRLIETRGVVEGLALNSEVVEEARSTRKKKQ